MKKAFGSGYFGEWIEDSNDLPAYRYTCDQTSDPKAVSPVNPIWRSPTDHSHQVGNDRVVGVVSNYGYVQLRQDEGAPKYLNDFDPENRKFGGGLGYLTDGEDLISTYFQGNPEQFERIFGLGYYQKIVKNEKYSADQVIFAPFGDDPLLISQVTITNHREQAADLRWVEYWDCQPYQFSYRAQMQSFLSRGKESVPGLRRKLSDRFNHEYSVIADDRGLLNTKKFKGYGFKSWLNWVKVLAISATVGKSFTGGAPTPPVKEASLDDLAPPPTFLVALDGPADGMMSDADLFFGDGGVESPSGLGQPLTGVGAGTAAILERKIHLEPGESKTLYFAYGYLPGQQDLTSLLEKYQKDLPHLFAKSSEAWKSDRIKFEVPGDEWVDRELLWHNYYLRSNLTYDTFFQEHILSQGHVYQYINGFQGAARDPLQHALPFTFSKPEIVKEVLRYTLKEVFPDGEITYGLVGHGMRMPVPFRPSDQEMWLLWLASEYVLATRDLEFLDEVVPIYPVYGPKAKKMKVKDILALCYTHLTQDTGTGRHGLMRMSNGDWNDGAVLGFVEGGKEEEVREHGESVLNAAFATYTLDIYARLLQYAGNDSLAADALAFVENQKKAVREQWVEETGFFRRQWLTEQLGWVGEDVLWLEPQPWAIIGGGASKDQIKKLIPSMNKLVRDPSPIGAFLYSKGYDSMPVPPGDMMNAGVWPSINGTLIWALAMVDGDLAWDEYKKNMLAMHAEAYPEIWYGIWSGPDCYNSVLSKYPGMTYFNHMWLDGEGEIPAAASALGTNWTDFPVMNMHPHAWPLYDTPKLLGAEFTIKGVEFAPTLMQETYRFDSPLLGFEKTEKGYAGWYAPLQAGTWQIHLTLSADEAGKFSTIEVNGKKGELSRENGQYAWSGESKPGQPLDWKLS